MSSPERHDRVYVLSVDPHIRRIGFAFFEDSSLDDWGTKTARGGVPSARVRHQLIPFLVDLLDRFAPSVLLVPGAGRGGMRRSAYVQDAIRALTAEATRRDIAVYAVTSAHVRIAFRDIRGRPARNKTVINRLLVERYSQLTASLPRRRRVWEPEHYFTPLFNAVSMYWAWRERQS